MEPFLERMVEELNELVVKVMKLESFMDSPKFNQLGVTEQRLLLTQRVGMDLYKNALELRLGYYEQH